MFKKCFTHIIMVAMATYPQSPQFLWKMKLFKSSPFFLLLFLKQELKKKYQECYIKCFTHIIMVVMATHPHPHPNFCEKWKKIKSSPFLLIILKQELKKILGMLKKCFKELDYTFH
jgi:hypothetical protein